MVFFRQTKKHDLVKICKDQSKYSVLIAIILISAIMIGGLYIRRVSKRKKIVPAIILGVEQQLEEENVQRVLKR